MDYLVFFFVEMNFPSFPCNGFMYAGIIEGFSFDSEDEADKMPKSSTRQTDQNEGDEKKTNGKTKGKAEKASVCSPSVIQSSSIK